MTIKRDGFLKNRTKASVFLQGPDYITFFHPYLQFRVLDALKSPSLNPCDLLSLTIFSNLFSVILLPSASLSPSVFPPDVLDVCITPSVVGGYLDKVRVNVKPTGSLSAVERDELRSAVMETPWRRGAG